MEFIGIDVHKREGQVCILAAEGEVIEKRIRTERERFAELTGRPVEGEGWSGGAEEGRGREPPDLCARPV